MWSLLDHGGQLVNSTTHRTGARQFCEFRLDSADPPLPVVVEPVALDRAMERDDGFGATDAPVHPAPLQPSADQRLAPTLDNTRRHTEALFPEAGIVHACAIGLEVRDDPCRLVTMARVSAQRGDDEIKAPPVEFVASGLAPLRHEITPLPVEGPGNIEHMLFGMKPMPNSA